MVFFASLRIELTIVTVIGNVSTGYFTRMNTIILLFDEIQIYVLCFPLHYLINCNWKNFILCCTDLNK